MKTKREDEEEERRLKDEANKRNQFKLHDIEFFADKNQEEIVAPSSKKSSKTKNTTCKKCSKMTHNVMVGY